MLETLNYSLDLADIEYLADLIYTIREDRELSDRLIPLQNPTVKKGNFFRLEAKINQIVIDRKIKIDLLKKPRKPFSKKRKRL
jgi:hypothetical protein